MSDKQLIFFSKTKNLFVLNLIRSNGYIICDGKIDNGYIKSHASYCNSGYAYLNNELTQVYGFVIFGQKTGENLTFEIELLCSSKNVGTFLMIKCLEYAKLNSFVKCNLMAKNERSLPEYYMKFGFYIIDTYFNYNNIECFIMELNNYDILNLYDLESDIFNINNIEELIPKNIIVENTQNIIRPNLSFLSSIKKSLK